jgi:hypothetical protein
MFLDGVRVIPSHVQDLLFAHNSREELYNHGRAGVLPAFPSPELRSG